MVILMNMKNWKKNGNYFSFIFNLMCLIFVEHLLLSYGFIMIKHVCLLFYGYKCNNFMFLILCL